MQSHTPVKCSRDEASKLLGDKMLQGWILLSASCPVADCYTPLMRSKKGKYETCKMFCVRCDQYVITEEEAKKQLANKYNEESAATYEPIAATNEESVAAAEEQMAEAPVEEERRHRIEQQFRLEQQAKQTRAMQELEPKNIQYPAAAQGAAKRKIDNLVSQSSTDSDVNAFRRQTLAALYQARCLRIQLDSLCPRKVTKMEALTDSLSPKDHSERLISVAKADSGVGLIEETWKLL